MQPIYIKVFPSLCVRARFTTRGFTTWLLMRAQCECASTMDLKSTQNQRIESNACPARSLFSSLFSRKISRNGFPLVEKNKNMCLLSKSLSWKLFEKLNLPRFLNFFYYFTFASLKRQFQILNLCVKTNLLTESRLWLSCCFFILFLAPLCRIRHQFSRTGRPKDNLLEHLKWTHKRCQSSTSSAEKRGETCWRSPRDEPEGKTTPTSFFIQQFFCLFLPGL